jgi:hypothetical protein
MCGLRAVNFMKVPEPVAGTLQLPLLRKLNRNSETVVPQKQLLLKLKVNVHKKLFVSI